MAGRRAAAWRPQIVARVVELRPLVLAAGVRADRRARQLQALARLPEDGMTMGELATFLRVSGAAACVLAERLVAQGLAVRHAAPGDRRVVLLAPTPGEIAVAERYRENQRQAVAALLDRLSDAQVVAWLDVVEALAAVDPGLAAARVLEPTGAAL